MALGELGRHDMGTAVKERMLNFWSGLVNGKESKISYTMYSIFKNLYDQGIFKSKWIEAIHNNLNDLGLSYLWYKTEFNRTWFKHTISRISRDIATQTWLAKTNESGLCSTYKLFKKELKIEPYLTKLDKIDALYLCKFRTGNHRLPITTGRYNSTNIQERICHLCDLNEIGDEQHYIFKCKHFITERVTYISQTGHNSQDKTRLEALFNTKNVQQMKNLAKFTKIIMDRVTNNPTLSHKKL